jgi:hypothetical protein
MPLRNACFLSYRHGQYDLMREFIEDFHSALQAELEPMLGPASVFVDRTRMQAGQLVTDALARNLYESATFVMIYTPTYFARDNTYCAREFHAMEKLERARLAAFETPDVHSCGLIIPVVLRGAGHLPEEIRNLRQYYDFQSFQLGERRLSRHQRFKTKIRELAGYVCDRFHELQQLPEHYFNQPNEFCLPAEHEIQPILERWAGFKPPFPGVASLRSRSALWARS